MYDYSDEWIYRVGMPAKSGVSGGIMAILPGQFGIGVFSQPLDQYGNSVRGIKVCQRISKDFSLHLFNVPRASKSVIRSRTDATHFTSKRFRSREASEILKKHGGRIKTWELQGELTFISAEVVIREIMDVIQCIDFAILDLKRVTGVNESSSRLFLDLLSTLSALQKTLVFTFVDTKVKLAEALKVQMKDSEQQYFLYYDECSLAQEGCENRVIRTVMGSKKKQCLIPFSEHELCYGLSRPNRDALQEGLGPLHHFLRGEIIVKEGEPPNHLYFLMEGSVSIYKHLPSGESKKVTSLSAGMCFGEMALVEQSYHSADVCADEAVSCFSYPLSDFDRLDRLSPGLKTILFQNVERILSRRLRRASEEISLLKS